MKSWTVNTGSGSRTVFYQDLSELREQEKYLLSLKASADIGSFRTYAGFRSASA